MASNLLQMVLMGQCLTKVSRMLNLELEQALVEPARGMQPSLRQGLEQEEVDQNLMQESKRMCFMMMMKNLTLEKPSMQGMASLDL